MIYCMQACTEASYLEFRKGQLSLRAEAKALTEPKDASTHTSIESADWAASLRSSAPATNTTVPQPKETTTPNETVSPPKAQLCLNHQGGPVEHLYYWRSSLHTVSSCSTFCAWAES